MPIAGGRLNERVYAKGLGTSGTGYDGCASVPTMEGKPAWANLPAALPIVQNMRQIFVGFG